MEFWSQDVDYEPPGALGRSARPAEPSETSRQPFPVIFETPTSNMSYPLEELSSFCCEEVAAVHTLGDSECDGSTAKSVREQRRSEDSVRSQ